MAISKHTYVDVIAMMVLTGFVYRITISGTASEVAICDITSAAFQYIKSGNTDAFNLPEFKEKLLDVWLWLKFAVLLATLYLGYALSLRPLNRVRTLGDLGYIPENGVTMKEMANIVRKRRLAGDVPPVYPNGWFVVLESRDLQIRESKAVSCLGLQLAVFRGEDGRAHIIDAYCPHMGASLAVGGQVKGDCLECPFHGWLFSGETGKCTHIPYIEGKIPDQAKVKSYISLERNGFIHIWYDAEGREPFWEPPEIEQITRGEWTYRGRTEHTVNAHIEEVPENGADVAHLTQVHSPFMGSGIDLRYTYSKLWSFIRHQWAGDWTPGATEEDKHIGTLNLTHTLSITGKELHILDLTVKARQIGPGLVYLTFDSTFGSGCFLHSLTPTEPLIQRALFQVYFTWYIPSCVGKFYLFSEALQLERDIMIWNNKRYQGKPVFVKSKEDSLVARHRRWYSQFYSENSPRLKFQKDTLDW